VSIAVPQSSGPSVPTSTPSTTASPSDHTGAPTVGHRALIAEALDNRRCPRRVRYELRDGVAVAAFSAASSTVAALAFSLLLSRVG
jgi:hypothetical protein